MAFIYPDCSHSLRAKVVAMAPLRSLIILAAGFSTLIASAACPYGYDGPNPHPDTSSTDTLESRDVPPGATNTDSFLNKFTINSTDTYLTSDVGGPIEDQNSLTAGERGPTLLEDFIFRQKITHFDHERVGAQFLHCTRTATYTRNRYQNVLSMLEERVRTILLWCNSLQRA